jgi:hypothetical protein
VLIHHLPGAWRTDFAVSRTPKPVMLFGVFKAAVPLTVYARPQQGLCPVISLRFLCSHAREYLFSRTCACCLHWRAPSCFLDVPMEHALAFIGKVNSPGKSAFSGSLQRQRDASFAHCQGHNGWRLAYRMHVYAGGSDHMLYQRITVLTPVITVSCSSVQPSFLAFIVVLVLFRGLMMVRTLFEKNIQKFTSRDVSKLEVCFSGKRARPVNFSTLTCR